MVKFLTKEEYEKLKKELNYLKTEKRKEIAEDFKRAIDFGDISENAAYDEARSQKGFLESRISELKSLLAEAKVIESKGRDSVGVGSTVELESNGEKMKFRIVGSVGTDVSKGKISYESPLGKALMGKKKGEIVEINVPAGRIKYKILKIK